ncbi:UNVERIFIED_CONTAM: MLP-like protein 28 [Sesamum radiatum]|uniref:MLP-like protein 28 n=1 Tax=Sesamum radiatum TaxID=300843 RepID=A0AAW2NQI1_SESRA
MAGLPCKLIAQVAFKAGGDVFHRLVCSKPHHLANITPGKIQACDLHQGNYGTDGSVIQWKYTLDQRPGNEVVMGTTERGRWASEGVEGKAQTVKQLFHDIDDTKKQIKFKMLEGDLVELYKNMVVTVHFETKGGVDFITWTIDYEQINPDNPHPLSFFNFLIELAKDIEAHIFG